MAAQAALASQGLSFQDRLCLLIAKREGWICVTNDTALRRACSDSGVPILWGLQFLLELVEAQVVTREEALDCARAISDSNSYITKKLLDDFIAKLP